MRTLWTRFSLVCLLLSLAVTANAAYIIAIDIDGADDGPITYNSHFGFGNDTTTAATSVAGTAFGLPVGDSLFGGDGTLLPDTYIYTYNPSIDADNLVLAPGQDLGGGNFATGTVGGGMGLYNVYATWPATDNVSGGDTLYEIVTTGSTDSSSIDQNSISNVWVLIGQVNYTSGAITITQSSSLNTFVSMRAAGVLFERASRVPAVPEPSSLLLLSAGLAGIIVRRRARTPR